MQMNNQTTTRFDILYTTFRNQPTDDLARSWPRGNVDTRPQGAGAESENTAASIIR